MVGFVARALIFGFALALVADLLGLDFDWRLAVLVFAALVTGGFLERPSR